MKVFLGGTVNGSTWREYVKPRLKIDYFDPVVKEWNDEAYQRELFERKHCDFCLYVITAKMTGYYSIAEVIDDSFKRPDRTIFCYLPDDEGIKFDDYGEVDIQILGTQAIQNGGICLRDLDEIVDFLNSALLREKETYIEDIFFNNVFISYGRKHSLAFARKLHDRLKQKGYGVWFDMNDIPLGVDFQEQIDQGIEKSDNFIFIISPHSVKSEYCLKEIVLAIKYGKRIIPILHIEPTDCWDKMHPVISKLNWIYFREKEDFSIPLEKWQAIDNFDDRFQNLLKLIESQKDYVHLSSILLHGALQWERNQKASQKLLSGNDRMEAENWLITNKFVDNNGKDVQPPCFPTDLHCEFITESRKYANNYMTDVLVSYVFTQKDLQQQIIKSLAKYNITTWLHEKDISKGEDLKEAIKRGIEKADNYIYLISKESHESEICKLELQHALSCNKRIIPVLVEKLDNTFIPQEIRSLQYIDLTDNKTQETLHEIKTLDRDQRVEKDIEIRKGKSDFEKDMDDLVNQINAEKNYFEQHKLILNEALTWQRQNYINSLLLRGAFLENAQAWLKIAENKPNYKPTDLQRRLIEESTNKIAELVSEVYICYAVDDIDFAEQLNEKLKKQSKITWIEDKSISSTPTEEYRHEIRNNIELAENFMFVLSPEFLASPDCILELDWATRRGKRMIAIQSKELDLSVQSLSFKNVPIINFSSDKTDFDTAFTEVIKLLDFDKDHIQNHNKWLQRAIDWESRSKDKALLLRGSELTTARNWLKTTQQKEKQPAATRVHKDYIETSFRKSIESRIRVLFASIILIVVSGMALFSFFQWKEAVKLQKGAETTKESLRLMSLSTSYSETENGISFALAKRAYDLDSNDITRTVFSIYSDELLNKTIAKHKDVIRGIAFSPDNKYVATCSYDKTASLWDLSGNLVQTFKGHKANIRSIAFSPKGDLIATAALDSTIKIWNLKGENTSTITQKFAQNFSVCFSSDGKQILAGCDDNNAYLYDLKGVVITKFVGHRGKVYTACFSPDNQNVLTASADRTFILWSIDGKRIRTFTGHNSYVSSAYFSPDGKTIISGSGDNTTCLWTLDGAKILTIKGSDEKNLTNKGTYESESVVDSRFSTDGKRIIVCYKFANMPFIYDINGEFLRNLKGHNKGLFQAVYSPNGKYILTCSQDYTARLWAIAGNDFDVFRSHKAEISSGFFSTDGNFILTCANDYTVHLTDIRNKKTRIFNDSAMNAALSKDGKTMLTACTNGAAHVWDSAGTIVLTLIHDTVVSTIGFSPDEQLIATACWDNNAYLWNLKGEKLQTFKGHSKGLTSIEFSPDGKYILTGSADGTAMLWDLSGKNIRTFADTTKNGINSVTFSPDGKLVAFASEDNTAKLWTIEGKKMRNFEGHKDEVWAVYFSPNGKFLLTGSKDKTAKLWALDGELIQTFSGHTKDILDVDFSPDGNKILTVSEDNSAIIWEIHQSLKTFLKSDIWNNLSDEQMRVFKIK